jgi:hypothetical protein
MCRSSKPLGCEYQPNFDAINEVRSSLNAMPLPKICVWLPDLDLHLHSKLASFLAMIARRALSSRCPADSFLGGARQCHRGRFAANYSCLGHCRLRSC